MAYGMVWLCEGKKDWNEHIKIALNYYREKYKAEPTKVYVHPTIADMLPATVHGLQVKRQKMGGASLIRLE